MIEEIFIKMLKYSNGNLHDINHFIKVWSYAKTIGQLEKIDPDTQLILEIAALTHDIACPLCRQKYGNTNGKYQEQEGMVLVEEFLKEFSLSKTQIERIVYLVGHHHTLTNIKGLDYQILIEADYIVNSEEMGYSKENIEHFINKIVKTQSAKTILENLYLK